MRMRLIDAEPLKELFPDNGEGSWTYNATVKAYIDAQPTVQPETNCLEIPNNSDTISRQQAIDVVSNCGICIQRIVDLPSAQPERKTGHWIHDGFDHPHGIDWCHCSICGNRESVNSVYTQVEIYPYCAKCGAKMDGKRKE